MSAGKVYLVGAGPGDPELRTLRARRLITEADAIVYDHLVAPASFAEARPGCERIFVGKKGGHPCRPQSEIDDLLVSLGRQGKQVVRLKGGDPFIFGRGGEEAAALAAAGVPFEVVPGVTAALAAAAYAGIPLTHRAHNSAVVFLTGHEDPAKPGSALRWEDYARLGATLCIYMGVRHLARIAGRLQAGGLSADTPAAIVQSATTGSHRQLLATLGTLADKAAAEHFEAPAIVIVGEVAANAAKLAWFEPQAEAAAAGFRFAGAEKMKAALIDNGSFAPEAHRNLRSIAAELSRRSGRPVEAVSWKHSDRIPAAELGGVGAATLAPWLRAQVSAGEREFLFVPYFISPQGAIGSALRGDLEALQKELGSFDFRMTPGLRADADPAPAPLARIVADLVRQTLAGKKLLRPRVVVVDHGGPAPASAALRDRVAAETAILLGREIGPLEAASLESPDGPEYAFNHPLFAEALGRAGSTSGDLVVAPLFLAPGRHAGPEGDLARIARAAETAHPGLRCHFTALVGSHPDVAQILAGGLT